MPFLDHSSASVGSISPSSGRKQPLLSARSIGNRDNDDRSVDSDDSSDFESPVRHKPSPESQAATSASSVFPQIDSIPHSNPVGPLSPSNNNSAPNFHLMCDDDDDSSAGSDSEESSNVPSQDCDFDVECIGTQPRNAAPDKEASRKQEEPQRPAFGFNMKECTVSSIIPSPTDAVASSEPFTSSTSNATAATPWSFLKTSNADPISSHTPAQSNSRLLVSFEETPSGIKRSHPSDCETTPMATSSVTETPTAVVSTTPSSEVSAEAAAGAFLETAYQRSSRQHGARVPVSLVQENPKRKGTKTAARYELYKHATSLAELATLGATPADLRHDLARGYLTLIGQPFTPPISSHGVSSKKSAAPKNASGGKRGASDAGKPAKKSASSSSVSWAKSKELRRERNERRAKLREGDALLPAPIVLFDSTVPIVTTVRHSLMPQELFTHRELTLKPNNYPEMPGSDQSSAPSIDSMDITATAQPSVMSGSSTATASKEEDKRVKKEADTKEVRMAFRLPVNPCRAQVVTLKAAADAVAMHGVGLLESPTGTGKTLALLTAALECQWVAEQRRLERVEAAFEAASAANTAFNAAKANSATDGSGSFQFGINNSNGMTEVNDSSNPKADSNPPESSLEPPSSSSSSSKGGARSKKKAAAPPAPEIDLEETPRVVWVARTHDQLEHAVREFKRLPYRPLMSLRLSRERYCAHPNVKVAPNRAEACEEATKVNGPGCSILDNAEKIGYPQQPRHLKKYLAGGAMAVADIEELVKEGDQTHTCPFHTAQDLVAEGAGLVFLTYPQLFEPSVRSSGGFGPIFKNAIVVIDEAHNVPQVAREAGTLRTDAAQISRHIADLAELRSSLVMAGEEQQATSATAASNDDSSSDTTAGKGGTSGSTFVKDEDKENSSESITETTGKSNLPVDESQEAGSGNKKLKEKIAKKKASTIASNYVEAIKVADEFTALLELLLGWLKRVGNTGFKRQPLNKQPPVDAPAPESKQAVVPEWSDEDEEEEEQERVRLSGTKHGLGEDEDRGEEKEEKGTAPLNLRPMQHDDERGLSGGSQEAVHLVIKVLQLKDVKAIASKVESLKKMRKALIDCGVESEAVRSQTVNDLEAMLWRLSYVLQSGGNDYQVVLRPPKVDSNPPFVPSKAPRGFGQGGGKGVGKGGNATNKKPPGGKLSSLWAGGRSSGNLGDSDYNDGPPLSSSTTSSYSNTSPQSPPPAVRLDIVCLRAARPFAFATQEARSVLLASGTLAPHQPLAHELGLEEASSSSADSDTKLHPPQAKEVSKPRNTQPSQPPQPPPPVVSQPPQPPPPKVRKMEWSTGKSIATLPAAPPEPSLNRKDEEEHDKKSTVAAKAAEEVDSEDDEEEGDGILAPEPPARPYVWSSADHHTHVDQMVLRVPISSFGGVRLRLTASCKQDVAILDAIGAGIAACARAVPGGGVLVFFPSYALLEACEQRWAVTAAKAGGNSGSTSGSHSSTSSSSSYGASRGGKGKGKGGKGGKGKGKGSGKGTGGSSSSSSSASWEAALSAATRKEVFVERRDDVSTGEKVSADAFAALVAAYRVSAQRGASAIPGEISAAQSYASNASGGDGVGGNDGEGGVNEETDKSAANINAASTSANAAATTQTNKGRDGALLLAVMRGRSSEGADFRDAAARAVIVVGVPFPSLSTETRLIMAHRDYTCGKGSGNAWYEAEAYRQVSQAAGRLLRHANDFGALFLLDARFDPLKSKPSSALAPWILAGAATAARAHQQALMLKSSSSSSSSSLSTSAAEAAPIGAGATAAGTTATAVARSYPSQAPHPLPHSFPQAHLHAPHSMPHSSMKQSVKPQPLPNIAFAGPELGARVGAFFQERRALALRSHQRKLSAAIEKRLAIGEEGEGQGEERQGAPPLVTSAHSCVEEKSVSSNSAVLSKATASSCCGSSSSLPSKGKSAANSSCCSSKLPTQSPPPVSSSSSNSLFPAKMPNPSVGVMEKAPRDQNNNGGDYEVPIRKRRTWGAIPSTSMGEVMMKSASEVHTASKITTTTATVTTATVFQSSAQQRSNALNFTRPPLQVLPNNKTHDYPERGGDAPSCEYVWPHRKHVKDEEDGGMFDDLMMASGAVSQSSNTAFLEPQNTAYFGSQ